MEPPQGEKNIKPRLLLADDHNLLLEGLKSLLAADFDVAAAVSDGRELVAAALRIQPDVVVLDIGMSPVNGLEAARQIKQAAPETRIVFLTQQSGKAYVQEAFRAGASAYVLKQSATSELKPALHQALEGKQYISAALAQGSLSQDTFALSAAVGAKSPNLTHRQRDILRLLGEHQEVKDIARTLEVSAKTVEFHISALKDELDLSTSEELMRFAARYAAE